MKTISLKSMKLTPKEEMKEDKLEGECPTCTEDEKSEGPEYPWGLKINLDTDTLTKLGISELPKIGTSMMLHAKVFVCDMYQSESEGSKNISLGIQITDMSLDAEKTSKSTTSVMYDKE